MNVKGFAARGVAAVRGGRWAWSELRGLRRTLGPEGLNAVVARPPTVVRGSLGGARLVLAAGKATCLERSLVMQSWLSAYGNDLDVIVAVKRSESTPGDTAHAWIDGFDADCSDRYAEIRRVPAQRPAPSTGDRPGQSR